MAGHVFAGNRPVHIAHGAGKEPETVRHRRHFILENADARLAAIQRLERGEGLGLSVDGVGELQQQGRALGRRGARPGVEGLRRGVHR